MKRDASAPVEGAEKLAIGIVGLGSIGARHLRNFASLGVGTLIATDADPAQAAAMANAPRAQWADSLDELLAARTQAVVVCTPSHLHAGPAVAALEAGRHVFIEKPVATTAADARRIVDASDRAGRVVLVGCNLRFHPGVSLIKDALDRGLIGKPLLARAEFGQYLPDWRPQTDYRRTYSARAAQGGGIILECVHELDYLRWFAGEVAGIAGYNARLSSLEIDAEDSAALALRFKSGLVAEVHADYLRPWKRRGCEVIGTEGVVAWVSDGVAPERLTVRLFERGSGAWRDLYRTDSYEHNDQYVAEARHFLDCVLNGATPLLDARGGAAVLELALRARAATTDAFR